MVNKRNHDQRQQDRDQKAARKKHDRFDHEPTPACRAPALPSGSGGSDPCR
jgi:hypothetical protein